MKKFNLFLIGLAAMGAVGCSSDEPKGGAENGEDTPRVEIELSRGQQEVVNAQNGFALRLFNQLLSTGAPTKNHIVS
ncbi:MAG: periplasmic heavy metal sensor, partial [Muribaculaceae bacterium]|nr:periplasmic heavy metal sensor [Muribaculaceae bacterium]